MAEEGETGVLEEPRAATQSSPEPQKGAESGSRGRGGIKKKVVHSPSLEKVLEGSPSATERSFPDSFGVKSYIHHFYEHGFRDPEIYEEDGYDRYLLQPHRRRFRCAARWWKTFLCVGVVLLVVGLISILVGYLSPQRDPVIGHEDNLEIVDRSAVVYNYNLEIAKVAGLVTFCCGGVALTISLLFPSFFHQCCDPGDSTSEDPFISSLQGEHRGSLEGIEGLPIPVTSSYDAIQPGNTGEFKPETTLQ